MVTKGIGTKGRDLLTWLAVIAYTAFLLTFHLVPLLATIIFFFGMLWQHLIERPKAIRYRQVLLLPIYPWLARLWVRGRIQGNWSQSYEVHVEYDRKRPIKEQREAIVNDFCDIIRSRPGVFLWETFTNIPRPFKKLIHEKAKEQQGFWGKGTFFPRPPLTYRHSSNKRLRHGAVLLTENEMKEGNLLAKTYKLQIFISL